MSSELPTGWLRATLGDICLQVTSGGTPARKRERDFYAATGHRWVKTKELLDRPIYDTEEHITDLALSQSAAKLLPRDTILVAMYASPTVGRLGVLRESAACNQACAALIVDPSKAHYRYVFYALLAERWRLQQIASGSAQQNINAQIVRRFDIPLPPLAVQHRIAAVLGSIDDKIESNRRIEGLCAAAISAFFDEHCVRRAGSDWAQRSLADIAVFVNGKNFTKGAAGSGRPVLRIKELNSGLSGSTVWNDVAAGPDSVASHYDLLFAWSGTLGVHRWDGPEALINQHIFKVISTSYPTWWVECWLRRHLERFQRIAKDKAVTMGHIRRADLNEAKVVVPPPSRLSDFDAVAAPMDQLRASAAQEARSLAEVRDTILPKLVSGRIRVPAHGEGLAGAVAESLDLAESTA